MHQQQQRYYQDDQDPFDLFNIFFNGQGGQFEFHNGNVFRRRQQRANQNVQPPQGYKLLIYQLIPFILFVLMYILPFIFKTVSLNNNKTIIDSFISI
jgi:hypothetical protein